MEASEYFWINNGPIVGSLEELPNVIETISEEQFKHHVNSEKNDFVTWIDNCCNDSKLAKSLKRVKRKKTFVKKIRDKLGE